MVRVYGYARGAVVGKTGKTAVSPGFSGIDKGGDATVVPNGENPPDILKFLTCYIIGSY